MFLERYEEWVEEFYDDESEEEEDNGILESTTGDDFSSVGASVADQSVAVAAAPTAPAIAEEDEN